MKELRRLIPWLRPYTGRILLAVLCAAGAAALTSVSLSTLIPYLRTLFDPGGLDAVRAGIREHVGSVSPGLADGIVETFVTGPMAVLAWLLAAVIVMTILKGVFRFLNAYLVGSVALSASRDLTNRLFESLIRQPVLFFETEGVGTVASRFTADADEVVRALKTLTGTLFREPLQFLFLLALVLLISAKLTLVSFVLFPAVGWLIWYTGRAVKRSARRMLAHRSRLLAILQEAFFGIRIVQTFRREAAEAKRYHDENELLLDKNRKLLRVDSITSPAMELLVVVGVSGALLMGGAMVVRGELHASLLITFYVAVAALYEPVRKLGASVPRIQTGLAGANRIFAYLDREPEVTDAADAKPLPPLAKEIRFEGVTFTHGGRSEALTDVTLSIRAGEQIAFVGPSGSGKTTLVGLLLRFFDPERGAVRIDGADIRNATLDSLRSQIALVPQDTVLMNDTVRANIAFSRPEATDEEVREAARAAHALEFVTRLPDGLDTVIGERGAALSGGQRQRIALARALLPRPRVLILDEAVSNIDEESARTIRAALEESRDERTTIVVTHRLDTLSAADRVAVIASGRLEAIAPPGELDASSPTWRALVGTAPGRSED